MSLKSILWLGVVLGIGTAGLVVMYQASKDPKNKKGPYYYGMFVHKWVWLWVLLLLLALVLWVANVISGYWVWMIFLALVTFVIWAFVLGLFRPLLVGMVVWGQKQVDGLKV